MTEKGAAFVDRMQLVDTMVKAGTPVFAAMAAGLEEEDWLLIYVAARRLALDVVKESE